jgi:hypothetical protein
MNRKIHYKQLKLINATADYITRLYKTALYSAQRGNDTLVDTNFKSSAQNNFSTREKLAAWNYRECRYTIEAAIYEMMDIIRILTASL